MAAQVFVKMPKCPSKVRMLLSIDFFFGDCLVVGPTALLLFPPSQ
jgi:hypothetical protein